MINKRVRLMRDLMYKIAGYNYSYCYKNPPGETEETFKRDFPIAYEKLIRGETITTKKDMGIK